MRKVIFDLFVSILIGPRCKLYMLSLHLIVRLSVLFFVCHKELVEGENNKHKKACAYDLFSLLGFSEGSVPQSLNMGCQ